MADTFYAGGRRRPFLFKARSSGGNPGKEAAGPPRREPLALGLSACEKTEGKRKGRPNANNPHLQAIPEAFSEKLSYSCCYCEAAFSSETRLEKHKAWNHAEKLSADIRAWKQGQKLFDRGSVMKRRSGSSIFFTKRTKQAKIERLASQRHPENGEFASDIRGSKESGITLAGLEAMRAESLRELKQEGDSLSPEEEVEEEEEEEEDPERMRHRRKQKTPKKFTGEQPSISGTFGLKGLGKTDEKSKVGHHRKPEGSCLRTEIRRRPLGLSARREVVVYTAGSMEDTWQREIAEKGEALCSNCKCVTRKTILGLRKHMDVCQKLQDALKCQHCRKQFKSKAGLNYHTMAEHINKPEIMQAEGLSEHEERERLRKVLKQMGKLKCPNEGCTATFTSLMGYQYHQKRCGKEPSEVEKPMFACRHCAKTYRSKAGHDYHVRSEHTMPSEEPQENLEDEFVEDFERTPSGRIRRRSAQVAVFHLQEIAEDELAKDWNKRRIRDDLVPDSKLLNYIRPGLPTFHPRLLENWKNEVKEQGHIMCPNHCCQAIYSSVSGLKAHLANCNQRPLLLNSFSAEGAVRSYNRLEVP
ncbi:zinc finger protein 512B isoform X2 [Ambystoma mexicanum]|uniref:zinc finger protein 512B isoform X2 n=1 Tax=Ambystoma mexicanum TaxID=8296 RepID=UPI0037E85F63